MSCLRQDRSKVEMFLLGRWAVDRQKNGQMDKYLYYLTALELWVREYKRMISKNSLKSVQA